jgi:TolA-binding protein
MKDHMRKFVLALALLSSTTSAFAQQTAQPARSGTPEEQAACNRDVQRHCRAVINQGDFTILACLQQNRSQISAACNQVLKNHGQ